MRAAVGVEKRENDRKRRKETMPFAWPFDHHGNDPFLCMSVCSCFPFPVDQRKLQVRRVVSGALMTSLNMAGVSLTMLKLDDELTSFLGRQLSRVV